MDFLILWKTFNETIVEFIFNIEMLMKNIFLFLSLVAAGSLSAQNEQNSNAVYPIAEYDRAALIVMHEPNEELFVGTMHPAAALFMDYFNADAAAKEHKPIKKSFGTKGLRW